MIIHHKNIQKIELGLKKPLKYSENYTFIPMKFFDNSFKDCLFQTPKIFVPFGIQNIDDTKKVIDLSFQNKDNDKDIQKFIFNLNKIYKIIQKKYKNYNVKNFLKETNYDLSMRLKVNNSLFYNSQNKIIDKINNFSYGEFIIQLKGLWICNNDIWFQWLLLQGKIDTDLTIDKYCFIDEELDDKYNKMLKMGVPKEAIELKKKIDSSIPPPPPLPNFKISLPVQKIKASDLQKVKLKKPKEILKEKIKKKISNHFEPPTMEELQITISRLKKI